MASSHCPNKTALGLFHLWSDFCGLALMDESKSPQFVLRFPKKSPLMDLFRG
jgi:hypothetical protein